MADEELAKKFAMLCTRLNNGLRACIDEDLLRIALDFDALCTESETIATSNSDNNNQMPPNVFIERIAKAIKMTAAAAEKTDLLEVKINQLLADIKLEEESSPILSDALSESLRMTGMLRRELDAFMGLLGTYYANRATQCKKVHEFPNQPPEAYAEFDRHMALQLHRYATKLTALAVAVQKTLEGNVHVLMKRKISEEEAITAKLYS